MQRMLKISSVLMVLSMLVMLFSTETAHAQLTNIALQSNGCTATHSGGGSGIYAPSNYNDGIYNGCGASPWGWTSGTSGTGNWIQFQWTTPKSFDQIKLFYVSLTTRYMRGGEIHVWQNNQWVTHHTFLWNTPYPCDAVLNMNPVTTDRFRITNWTMSGSQLSNPNFREIEVYNTVTAPNDAGIASVDSPLNFCAGTLPITVTLFNYGTNQITSATINWTLNGAPQTAFNWTGLLDTLNGTTRQTQVTLNPGYSFQAGVPYTITAWTSMPNNVVDTVTRNDTTSVTRQAAISGTYTIGGASPDYPDFTSAVSDLNSYGVCGPVVFNVRSGSYSERIAIDDIAGASATNTITFQSETGNRADVTVSYSASGTADNGVVAFGSAKFVTMKNMTFRATGSSYSVVINLKTSTDCTVDGCELVGAQVNTTSNYAAVVYGYDGDNHRTTINDCGIRNGSYGGYMRGLSNTATQDYCVITNNEITNSYYTGWYSYYEGYLTFHDNRITLGAGYSYMYLTFFYFGHNNSIERNMWYGEGRPRAYGVYFYYQNYYVPGNSRFVNNMVTLRGQTYPYRIMYMYRTYNTLLAHNTWYLDGNYSGSYGVYHYYPTGCEYYNNIFSQAGTGYAWYMYQGSSMIGSDYNVFYTNGNNLAYWNGTRSDLTALQAASGMDQNSITKLPFYRDLTTGDLHLTGPSEDDSDLFGTLLNTVTDDIDHELRVQPYRGADEACYVLPGALTYEFVDGQGQQAAYAEAPGTIGIKYGVTFPPFASTVTFTVQFFNPVTNALVYQTTFQASKQANVDLFGTQYITLPPTLAAGAYRIEVIFNTKNSCDTYRDYMPYPSALLVVPEGRVPCVVWPGDVNNDGIVTYVDRRELNYYIYNANLRTSWLNGPQRYQADAEINPFTYLEWKPQAAAPWFTPEGCYMDTDGNGTINNLDYLAMKLNWTKVTPWYGGTPKAGATAASFGLDQNYPNPFNPSTMIRYTAPEASHVRLVVTDALGREVAELENGSVDAGVHEVQFDGSQLASGTYIATITMTGVESGMTFTKTIKMALSK